MKEKIERKNNLRAVVEVDERPKYFKYDIEANHMREEANIQVYPFMRLVQATKDRNNPCEALAWDDMTGMRLDAEKVFGDYGHHSY